MSFFIYLFIYFLQGGGGGGKARFVWGHVSNSDQYCLSL